MQYPKAVAYLKNISKDQKLTDIYDFALLEEILDSNRTFEQYLSLKEDIKLYGGGHIRNYSELYYDWLNDSISDIDLYVYKNRFREGQNIKYLRDYFIDSKEEHSSNSKGDLIEFKAYGQSQKMNREVIAFEGRFYDNLLTSYVDKTDNAEDYSISYNDNDILYHDMDLLKLLAENDCLDIFDEHLIETIIAESLSSVEYTIKHLEKVVNDLQIVLLTYEASTNKLFIPYYLLNDSDFTNGLKKYDGKYLLEDIIGNIKSAIEKTYIFSPSFSDSTWTKQMIDRLRLHCTQKFDHVLFNQLDAIRNTAIRIITDAENEKLARNESEKKEKRNRLIKKILLYSCIVAVGYFIYQRNNRENSSSTLSTIENESFPSMSNQSEKGQYINSAPGDYYVSEDAFEGEILYKDKKMSKKLSYRLKCMEKIDIDKVEDSMGYFDSYMNDNFQTIPKGWVKMKNLIPAKSFFDFEYGEGYRVKSDFEKVLVFKDYKKRNKMNIRLNSMDYLRVYKLKDGMAYFKDYYIGINKYSGWIETDKLEKGN